MQNVFICSNSIAVTPTNNPIQIAKIKKYYVYVLRRLKNGKRYVGYTQDIEHRLFLHNEGEVKSTARRKPFELIYTEEYDDKKSVMERERFLKTGKGKGIFEIHREIKNGTASSQPRLECF